ncbi:MAG: universal stress protein [Flavobacteriales bacterium]|nr:universal stress protein [Flavobacteriales bacterium]
MYNILVPTDFSEFSDFALQYGTFLAKKNDSNLYILHIVRNEEKYEAAQKKLKAISKLPSLREVKAHIVLEKGNNVSKNINKVAEELEVKLIIMGSNGVSNVEEMILGSNTENVIIKTRFDVLTVKHEMNSQELNTILFPSNFKQEAYNVFESVIKTAKAFNACIHLLKVGKDTPKDRERVNDFVSYFQLEEQGIDYCINILDNSSLELGILNYAMNNDIDLIAIGTHGKGAIKKLLQESTSQNLVRDAFRPVLTMRF